MKLKREFFNRSADVVAKELLGKRLIRVLNDGSTISGTITETEAYLGVEDRGCHSYGGRRTKRNEVMYGKPGIVYVYFTYGMHWMLNVVTSNVDDPQAVLIRSLDNVKGPGRLTKNLEIDGKFNGTDITKSKNIYIENTGTIVKYCDILVSPRIGIDYAREWKEKPLRFIANKYQ